MMAGNCPELFLGDNNSGAMAQLIEHIEKM